MDDAGINESGREEERPEPLKSRVWNRDFTLLWQGQLVSSIGDVVYRIALGFWILEKTGSTALMGTLMAASAIPQIVIGPLAGVVVDRTDRKWMLVAMDLIRGLTVVVIAGLAIAGMLRIWEVFLAAILIGIASAFFNPAVMSSIPDIVPKSGLLKANSSTSLIHSLSGILGNAGGGALFSLVGAPILFLVNGISYIFSAGSECFIRIPRIRAPEVKPTFFADLREGFRCAWNSRGLRTLFINAGILNFFLAMAGVLFLPFFQRSEAFGASVYGLAMTVLTGGSLIAFLLLSALTIPARIRFRIFIVSAVVFSFARGFLFSFSSMGAILGLFAIVGFTVAILNSFIGTMTQLVVPQEKRGKVFALLGTLSHGLTPIGMAIGGVLGEFLPIPVIMLITATIVLVGFIPVFLSRELRDAFAREE